MERTDLRPCRGRPNDGQTPLSPTRIVQGCRNRGEREEWELPGQFYGRDRTFDFRYAGESQRSTGLGTATEHTFGNSMIGPGCVRVR